MVYLLAWDEVISIVVSESLVHLLTLRWTAWISGVRELLLFDTGQQSDEVTAPVNSSSRCNGHFLPVICRVSVLQFHSINKPSAGVSVA
jgi:hypothetical protein